VRKKLQQELTKRERQIMEIIYKKNSASAAEIHEEMANPPGYSTVRSILTILENKGLLVHKKSSKKYIYSPTIPRKRAMLSAVKQLLKTYFNDSLQEAVEAMIEIDRENLAELDLDRLTRLIETARKEENK
jgi:predicted transcriptional regulator